MYLCSEHFTAVSPTEALRTARPAVVRSGEEAALRWSLKRSAAARSHSDELHTVKSIEESGFITDFYGVSYVCVILCTVLQAWIYYCAAKSMDHLNENKSSSVILKLCWKCAFVWVCVRVCDHKLNKLQQFTQTDQTDPDHQRHTAGDREKILHSRQSQRRSGIVVGGELLTQLSKKNPSGPELNPLICMLRMGRINWIDVQKNISDCIALVTWASPPMRFFLSRTTFHWTHTDALDSFIRWKDEAV
ncbi:uncharacterized protein LOC124388797 [Silurus meridionalis]|uniref:uncharacterized protein LOC124388797 n=1 Tax=Silurus meridionalis TaxID=175797 RepID=UPI001EEBE3D1|nr:uncharacterized protein LOC124388797 [Silurus meridionalis]